MIDTHLLKLKTDANALYQLTQEYANGEYGYLSSEDEEFTRIWSTYGDIRNDLIKLNEEIFASLRDIVQPEPDINNRNYDTPLYSERSLNPLINELKRTIEYINIYESNLSTIESNVSNIKEKYAFISYQTTDKLVAGKIKQILENIGIEAFLAHEDINVSSEWQDEILMNLSRCSLFICLLSKHYLESPWCLQESGVARFKDITIIPLSLDGTIPSGFISKYQSIKIDPNLPKLNDLIPGLINFDGIDIIIKIIDGSSSYRDAESNFELIIPYLSDLTEEQAIYLLEAIISNRQIYEAIKCKDTYIPQVVRRYGNLIPKEDLEFLKSKCKL